MSEITPELVAATPPTPENVAEMLTSGDNDYHDGNYWHPSISADGNVVSIGITAYDDDGGKVPEAHFQAVVVKGEGPVVIASPEFLAAARALYRAYDAALSMPTDQIVVSLREVQSALKALTTEQMAALAGEGVEAAQAATAAYEEPVRITAETYCASREKATGRVELEIGGSGRRVVIDLGDDGDEILAGLLGFHERDPEDTFFDFDEDDREAAQAEQSGGKP